MGEERRAVETVAREYTEIAKEAFEAWKASRMTQSNAKDDAPERCECGQFFKPCFECGTSAKDDAVKAVALARETVALMKEADDAPHSAACVREGKWDDSTEVRLVLAGVRAAIEAMRAAHVTAQQGRGGDNDQQ